MSTPTRQVITVADEELAQRCARGRVVLIDDDPEILAALCALLELEGFATSPFASAQGYLRYHDAKPPQFPGPCCVLSDVKMPDIDGLELQRTLAGVDDTPLILMSGASGALEAASAFRAGAVDFLVKPVDADTLLAALAKALALNTRQQREKAGLTDWQLRMDSLTQRERDVATLVVQGLTNQATADTLQIALRTVKLHRQRVMEKLGADSTADLVRITARIAKRED